MPGATSTRAGDDTPRNELTGWRVVAAWSAIAICLTVGGLAFDSYVLATHQLTIGHRAWDIGTLFLLGLGAYQAIASNRSARARIADLKSRAESN